MTKVVVLLLAHFLATPLTAQPGSRVEVHVELDLPSLLLDRQPSQSVWQRMAEEVVLDAWLADLQRREHFALWHFAAPQPGTAPEWQLKAAVVPGGVSEALLTLTLHRVLKRASNTTETETRRILRLEGILWPPVSFGAKTAAGIEELERDVTSVLNCLMGYSLCNSKDERADEGEEMVEQQGQLYDRRLFEALRRIPVARKVGWLTDVQVDPPNLLVPLRSITPFRLSTFRLACREETGPGHLIVASLESRQRHPEVGEGLVTTPKSFWQGRECYEVKAASLQTQLGPIDLRELPWEAVYLYEYQAPENHLFRASRPCEQGGSR